MRGILLIGLLSWVGVSGKAYSQSLPVLDQNPRGLRWQEVRTPHFRVIYPAGADSAAQRTAGRLEQVHGPGTATLGVQTPPIGVVLQAHTTVSNGFVTFLPRHSEFFITPQQGMGLGTVDWLDGLAVHEFRHVGQFDKARQGIGRLLVPLLGEGGLGVGAVGVPQWFFEGDAVGTETALTRSGRGRIPSFSLGLRANLLAGRLYNYQKANNGSLRDNVPNWYELGYFMTSYLKVHRGADAWARVLDRYYRFPFYPFSFSNGIKQTTGLRVEQLYARTMAELDSTWRAQQRELPPVTAVSELPVNATERVFTQYQYPQYVNDSTVLALKTGLGHIAQLVLLLRRGAERQVFVPGRLNLPEMLSVAGGRAVWPEFRQHPRWGQQEYSELKVLDLASGKVRRVGQGTRYAAAALSPDGQRLVAVQTDASYRHSLVLLNAGSGAVEQVLPNPPNVLYLQPRWHPDGRRIVAVTLSPAGKTIVLIDPAAGTTQPLLPVANVNLTNPLPWGDYVLYNSPQNGVDNIYAVSISTKQTFRVTSRPLGAYHASVSPDGKRLAFHDYRATGARVVEMPLDPAAWTPVPAATAEAPAIYADQLTAQEPAGRAVAKLLAAPDSARPQCQVRRYSPLAHAFNVFSWGLVQSPVGDAVTLGVRSQDLLSTTQVFAGLSYEQNEQTFSGVGAVSYQGLPLVVDVEGSYGGRDVALLVGSQVLRDQWRYGRLRAGVRLPLNLTRSKYLQALSLGSYYFNEHVYDYNLPVRRFTDVGPNTPLHAIQNSLSYVAQLKMSARDVAPRGGGSLLATWRTTPFDTPLQATQVGVQGSVFLPGLGRHHALRLRGGYQYQDQDLYQFSSSISFPRGEGYLSFDQLRVGSADYYLPIAYTHWSLGRWLYVQRLRATLFGDVAHGSVVRVGRVPVSVDYRNFGADFSVLFNVLRLRTPVEVGVRAVYSSLQQQWVVEPLAFSIRL